MFSLLEMYEAISCHMTKQPEGIFIVAGDILYTVSLSLSYIYIDIDIMIYLFIVFCFKIFEHLFKHFLCVGWRGLQLHFIGQSSLLAAAVQFKHHHKQQFLLLTGTEV